jgi:hypothetical protein
LIFTCPPRTLRSLSSEDTLDLCSCWLLHYLLLFPFFPRLLFPPPFLASFEALPASSEVMSIAPCDLTCFNLSSSFSSIADGLFVSSTCRPQPQIHRLLEVLRFDFFQNQICPFQAAPPSHVPLHRDLSFLCSALLPVAPPSGHHAPEHVHHTSTVCLKGACPTRTNAWPTQSRTWRLPSPSIVVTRLPWRFWQLLLVGALHALTRHCHSTSC